MDNSMSYPKSPSEQDSAYDSPNSSSLSLSPTSTKSSTTIAPMPMHVTHHSIMCPKCESPFIEPRVLPCLHTFCTKCLEPNKKTIACSLCRIDFCLPINGIEGLIPDYSMMNFIRSLKGDMNCTSCKTESIGAEAKCMTCNNFLCDSCLNAHKTMHCFETHRVMHFPRNFRYEGNDDYNQENVFCIKHLDCPNKFFCFDCNDPICQDCLNEDHGTHRIENLDLIGENLVDFMRSMMDENKGRLEELSMSIKYAQHTDWWLNSQFQEINKRISEVYNIFNSILLKHKAQQIQYLESSFHKLKSAVHNNTNLTQDTYEKTSRLTDFFLRLNKYSTVNQCLMFKKLLESKHNRFVSYKPKPIQCSLKFVSNPQEMTSLLHNTFGHVISDISGYEPESTLPKVNNYLLNFAKDYIARNGTFPFRYDRWSNTCLEDLKMLSDIGMQDGFKPYNSLKSTISRAVITYNWKFGSYGTLQGQFTEPNGVAVNAAGDIIIADTNNNRVQVFDKMGHFKFMFGDSGSDEGSLLFPNRVAVYEKTGDIVVTERAPTHQVQIYNQYGQFIRKFGANILQHPRAVTVDKDGNIIVVECKVMRVVIFDQNGEILNKFSCVSTLHFPNGIAVNENNEIFISDNRTHSVFVYNYSGKYLRAIGREGLTNFPIGVMLNKTGHVIVADNHNNFNLTIFTQDGQLVSAVESKIKHAQCYDAAIASDGTVVLTSKDYRVYIYLTAF